MPWFTGRSGGRRPRRRRRGQPDRGTCDLQTIRSTLAAQASMIGSLTTSVQQLDSRVQVVVEMLSGLAVAEGAAHDRLQRMVESLPGDVHAVLSLRGGT